MTYAYKVGDTLRLIRSLRGTTDMKVGDTFQIKRVEGQHHIVFDSSIATGSWTAPFLNDHFELIPASIQEGDIVRCIERVGVHSVISLTYGKEYKVLNVNGSGWIKVLNDKGSKQHYKPERFQRSTPTPTPTEETPMKNSNFTMVIPTSQKTITATVTKGILHIEAGCFNGTLAEAYKRADSRSYYTEALDIIETAAKTLEIPVKAEKVYTLKLTQSECDFLAVVGMKIGGDPTKSRRKYNDSIRRKLEEAGISTWPDTDGIEGSLQIKS